MLVLYVAPVLVNWIQDNIIELMMYLRGPGDKSMMTQADADSGGGMRKYIYASANATYNDFVENFYQKQPGLFYANIVSVAAYKDVLKVAAKGSGKKVVVHNGRVDDNGDPIGTKKSFNHFRRAAVGKSDAGGILYMEETADLLPKTALQPSRNLPRAGEGEDWSWGRLFDGNLKFASVSRHTGPPFRQGKHMVAEVFEGTLHWALFHPNAVPTVGFRENEGLGAWMSDTYKLVSPLFSPTEVYQHPGEVLYIPEGYFYAYKGHESSESEGGGTTLSSVVMREAPLPDVGTEYYALVEGRKRLAIRDYDGAIKLFRMGLDLELEVPSNDASVSSGQGRRSYALLSALGDTHRLTGDLEEAERAYRDALSQNARQVTTFAKYMSVVQEKYNRREEEARLKGTSCVPWLMEANRETRQKITSAAGLAQSSNVFGDNLARMNSTIVTLLEAKRDQCAQPVNEL